MPDYSLLFYLDYDHSPSFIVFIWVLNLLQWVVSTVIPAVERLPGDSDRVNQCLFLFRFLCAVIQPFVFPGNLKLVADGTAWWKPIHAQMVSFFYAVQSDEANRSLIESFAHNLSEVDWLNERGRPPYRSSILMTSPGTTSPFSFKRLPIKDYL